MNNKYINSSVADLDPDLVGSSLFGYPYFKNLINGFGSEKWTGSAPLINSTNKIQLQEIILKSIYYA